MIVVGGAFGALVVIEAGGGVAVLVGGAVVAIVAAGGGVVVDVIGISLYLFTLALCAWSLTVHGIRSLPMFFARRLYKSMKVNTRSADNATWFIASECFSNTTNTNHTMLFMS